MAVTGPTIAGDSTAAIKSGAIGNLLNLVGAENVREMQQLAVNESRLGIPLLIGYDVIHGHRILFPIPLGEASSFDPEVWTSSARESAKEAAAEGLAMTFAPMLDVARDPRWGRIAESPGEDPLVGALMAEAKVRGFQGADLAHADSLAACAKHYCAYGCVTAGRDYAAVDISDRTLHEVHMVPFAAAVSAGVAAIMPAFTDFNGVPMTANKDLLRDWLRGRLGFDGVVISDYNAIAELIRHGVAADLAEAAALALKAGRGYRHDGGCVSTRPAGCFEARCGQRRGNRPVGAPRVDAEGAARIIRGTIPAWQQSRISCGAHAAAATCAANRHSDRSSCSKMRATALPICTCRQAPGRDGPVGGLLGRNARRVVGRGRATGSRDRARWSAQRVSPG